MRQRIFRIEFKCLLEIIGAQLQSCERALVPVKASLQIRLIGSSVLGLPARELGLFAAGEFKPQLLSDLARNLFLHVKDVGEFAVVMLAPQLRLPLSIDQLNRNDQTVTRLPYATRD